MARNKVIYHWCNVYKMNFYFHRNWSASDFCKYAKKIYNYHRSESEMGDGVCLEIQKPDKSMGYVIWTRDNSKISVLAHECIHASMYLFDHLGIKYNSDFSEHFAYYVENLINIGISNGKS